MQNKELYYDHYYTVLSPINLFHIVDVKTRNVISQHIFILLLWAILH